MRCVLRSIRLCDRKIGLQTAPSRNTLSVLITAIGVSYLLQNLALLLFGTNRQFIVKFIDVGSFDLFGVSVSGISVIIWVTTIVIMLGLYTFIKRQYSDARCCVSEDKGAAQLMGINVNRTISITFVIGSALAGVASILYSAKYLNVDPYTGSLFGIKALPLLCSAVSAAFRVQ